MKVRPAIQILILLLAASTSACSLLRARQPLNWHITLEVDPQIQDRQGAVDRAVRVLESRLDALGLGYAKVAAQVAPGRIVVNLPDVSDRERLKQFLSNSGTLELSHLVSPPSPSPSQIYQSKEEAIASLGGTIPANRRVLPYSDRVEVGNNSQKWVIVRAPAIIDGTQLRNSSAVPRGTNQHDYSIAFTLKPEGAKKFAEWTAANINEYLAVILNDEVRSIAYIKSQISDSGEISGSFTKQAAEDTALILRSGAMPKVKIVEEGSNK